MKMDLHCSFVHPLFVCVIIGLLYWNYAVGAEAGVEQASTYIVHMDKFSMPNEFSSHEHWYKSLVSSVKGVTADQKTQTEDFYHYTYDIVLHGFSAKLTRSELDMVEDMPGHLSSFPDPVGNFHTTHSTEFLKLDPNLGLLPMSRFGQDVIVAMMDSGIWPESHSFLDNGMEPVPSRWRGTCENGTAFDPSMCNKKLIGARSFKKGAVAKYGSIDPASDYDSARDFLGHGSHTSSTAGGNYVQKVDSYGYARGTARGVAPAGRVAMYKIGWSTGIAGSDVLAGMERAITDRADVLSLSLGFGPTPYFENVIALGAFAAVKRGVVVVCSAGNSGPGRKTMDNGAPWIFTVGSSTIDRGYAAALTLGDGTVVSGSSFYVGSNPNGNLKISGVPLHYDIDDSGCEKNLDPAKVNGTVMLCMNTSYDVIDAAELAGAAALVMVGVDTYGLTAYPDGVFPLVILNPGDRAAAVVTYASSTTKPVVDIQFGLTVLGYQPAPAMADFSSRGPSLHSPNILKPDVTAPGVNVIAAWLPNSTEGNNYALISGTSMSCPHVAGLSALVKAVHSDWSPAAIRSALMTTSYTFDNTGSTITDQGNDGRPATPLEFGAGHVDPQKAVDPGLVYDVGAEDYFNFLCTLNYTTQQIQTIAGTPVSCPGGLNLGADALNYPSITAIFNKSSATSSSSKTFQRTVTNVGDDMSYYNAVVETLDGLNVQVTPRSLEFTHKFQKLNFSVTVEAEETTDVVYGYLAWIDDKGHVVKSPVVAFFE